MGKSKTIVGLIPACGSATRFPGLPVSKEIYPLALDKPNSNSESKLKVVSFYLLDKLRLGGARRAYFVLRKGKWDIPNYFREGSIVGLNLAYIVADDTPGTPYTIEVANPFIKNDTVLFGYPDILFKPQDCYKHLLERLYRTSADVIVGLFDLFPGQLTDRVNIGKNGFVSSFEVRSTTPETKPGWAIAAWTPAFTNFLHRFIRRHKEGKVESEPTSELFLGHVLEASLKEKMRINSVYFSGQYFFDIGTPGGLYRALVNQSLWS
jgi:glucose-1-phosphate thymidylyltransferase